jgi:hypothetical protein
MHCETQTNINQIQFHLKSPNSWNFIICYSNSFMWTSSLLGICQFLTRNSKMAGRNVCMLVSTFFANLHHKYLISIIVKFTI